MNEEKIVQGKPKKQYDKEFSRLRRKQWKQAANQLGFKSYGALLDHVVEIVNNHQLEDKIAITYAIYPETL